MVKNILLLLLLLLLLAGCSKQKAPEGPDIGLPIEEVNTRFRLEKDVAPYYSIKNNDPLHILVEVTTSDRIAFRVDYDVRMFILEDDRWEEIENKANYPGDSGEYFIILPYSPDVGHTEGYAGVVPYKSDIKESTILRIFFTGKIVRNGRTTEDRTAAYLDLTISP